MKKDPTVLIEHMLESIEDIQLFLKEVSKEEFEKNKEKINAVVRSLEIIGEAAKNISETLKEQHPEVAWKKIIGTRDVIIHQYSGVNLETIWEITQDNLPSLKKQLKEILKEHKQNKNA